ncbi:sigma factor-like helix-turn-helix DNA-binding protein [Streptomyces sp. NPDC059176]|uniref:sigma factor-like helix-turn-helix DNA-binding protein n=1 Tax=unclassified Streptomyces TaxID=2593676 RepID=UPI0036CED6AD
MRETRQSVLVDRRTREFDAFAAGAGGRLLHVATLLTAEPHGNNPRAQHLLVGALARTYAVWDRLHGEDPYDRTRRELATLFARTSWHFHHRVRSSTEDRGVLAALTPRLRLVVVLRLYEGVAEEQTAALLGLPEERVRALCARAVATLRSTGSARRTRASARPAGAP